ncbi:MAG TPA: glycosyltransferase family 4 protein [Thermoanaerobacterales bacterium]|nr:glycosyltransferase family 4 protein [Thermoanaerobacterales bacterium]
MKKVLHVITDTNIGGAGRYLFNLLSGWDYDRYEVMVACPAGGQLEEQLRQKNIKVFELSGGEKSLKFEHIKELMGIISREKIDIVHTHASFAGRIAGKLSGCRVVLTRHGLGQCKKGFVQRTITGILSRIFTDAIIAISRAVKISMMETGVPADMIKIIYNGIDVSEFNSIEPRLKKEFNLVEKSPIVGIVARLVPEKGYEYALKAMPAVLKKFPGAVMVIVGDGPLRKALEDLCLDLGIHEHVIFLGYQDRVETLEADFDVFLLPSVSEGLGLSLLEAMALAKPVVATEVGGIPEVVKSGVNGLLVPPRDPSAIAEAIIRILSSKQMAYSLGQAAKNTVFDRFSARYMAEKTMEVYDKILQKTGE